MGLKETFSSVFGKKPTPEEAPFVYNKMEREYFLALKEQYPDINTIFYPAVGEDADTFDGLENEFKIVTLDGEYFGSYHNQKRLPNYVKADFEHSPFKDEAFDLVFIQDADSDRFFDVFRTLKMGGVLVFSEFDCGVRFNMRAWEFDKMSGFERIEAPETNLDYHTFRKIGPLNQEDF